MAVHFEAGFATQCMREQGHAAEMLIKQPGTTCASIGWVQPEYAGNCETQNSMMNVSYSYVTGEKQERGMTQTWWDSVAESAEDGGGGGGGKVGEEMNAMKLIAPDKDVIACAGGKVCKMPRIGRWDVTWRRGSKGPVYIVFKPQ
ncbi:MAG: hypothetical protein OHK93_004314 [Ramalina farinacea]|uniref:Uncharacterized protein n=1 Tax=Ramalina farinacea TaxID=258253 RepID=A0AA43QIT3_9LECA|nr:hypothetical protein [Ramalina farinacea]